MLGIHERTEKRPGLCGLMFSRWTEWGTERRTNDAGGERRKDGQTDDRQAGQGATGSVGAGSCNGLPGARAQAQGLHEATPCPAL